MDRIPSKSASGKKSRNNTILCKWFPNIFDSLRRGLDLDTHDESLRIVAYEKSHVLAILERAKLITIIGGKPTQFRATEEIFRHKNSQLLGIIKRRVPVGTIVRTPTYNVPNEITEWGINRNGDDIIRHKSIDFDPDVGADDELQRHRRLGEIASRPGQKKFASNIHKNYGGKCAVTGCEAREVLEAAHIHIHDGSDDNAQDNGILLRADIHSLFDALLITLSEDGRRLEVSDDLTDPSYAFLREATVTMPREGAPPSKVKICNHRKRFFDKKSESFRE